MNYDPTQLLNLFLEVAEKACLSMEHADSEELARKINDYDSLHYREFPKVNINDRYLYESFRKIKASIANQISSIDFNPTYINKLAQYLDFQSFQEYQNRTTKNSEKNNSQSSEGNAINTYKQIAGSITNIGRDFKGKIFNRDD